MSAMGGVAAEPAATEAVAPRRRKARVASIILAIVLLAYAGTQQAAPATAEPPLNYEALLLLVTAFYTSLLALRWISPDAAWWVGIIQGIAAFVLAAVMAGMTAYVGPLIAAGYLIFITGRAFWARFDRARGIA